MQFFSLFIFNNKIYYKYHEKTYPVAYPEFSKQNFLEKILGTSWNISNYIVGCTESGSCEIWPLILDLPKNLFIILIISLPWFGLNPETRPGTTKTWGIWKGETCRLHQFYNFDAPDTSPKGKVLKNFTWLLNNWWWGLSGWWRKLNTTIASSHTVATSTKTSSAIASGVIWALLLDETGAAKAGLL